jgi:hypothetical protein
MDTVDGIVDGITGVLQNRMVLTAVAVVGGIYALNMLGDDRFSIGGNAALFLDKED